MRAVGGLMAPLAQRDTPALSARGPVSARTSRINAAPGDVRPAAESYG
jgi:hypothetical protein